MSPRPSHRLDILAVPADTNAGPIEAIRQLMADLVDEGVINPRGRPGPQAARWMPQGFAGLRLDLPEPITLYANRQGGFRVHCPVMPDQAITAAFATAMADARRTERPDQFRFLCPACGESHTLAETIGKPPFRFARLAVQTIDAEALRPTEAMVTRLEAALGPLAWVGVRT
ncbi:MAG: hypothetical protein AAGA48_33610 [Myxococcota bacterium]